MSGSTEFGNSSGERIGSVNAVSPVGKNIDKAPTKDASINKKKRERHQIRGGRRLTKVISNNANTKPTLQ